MNINSKGMKIIILDRDGVINQESENYIRSADEWLPIPGSLEAIAHLNHNGYRILIMSNQSGLARGYFSIEELNAIHRKMRRELSALGAQIEAVFFCPHSHDSRCRCRKPLPGLLEDIGRRLRIDMTGVLVVGDSFRDIQAAVAVGAAPILVRTGKGQETIKEHEKEIVGIPVYADLASVADDLTR